MMHLLAKAELTETSAYISLEQFLTDSRSIYDPGWLPYRIASYVIGKPLWWALQQLSIVGSDDTYNSEEHWKKVKGDHVVLSVLERAAAAVLSQQMPKTGVSLAESLYNFDSFKAAYAEGALPGAVLSNLDLKVLLRYLERDKRVIVRQGEVCKCRAVRWAHVPTPSSGYQVRRRRLGCSNLSCRHRRT